MKSFNSSTTPSASINSKRENFLRPDVFSKDIDVRKVLNSMVDAKLAGMTLLCEDARLDVKEVLLEIVECFISDTNTEEYSTSFTISKKCAARLAGMSEKRLQNIVSLYKRSNGKDLPWVARCGRKRGWTVARKSFEAWLMTGSIRRGRRSKCA